MDVEAMAKAFVVVELSATTSLGPSSHVPEAHSQPMFSPIGMRTTMDVEALVEFLIASAQPMLFPVDSSRSKEFSTTSVTVKLSKTGMGVIAQGNAPRDTFAIEEVYRRRDGSTNTLVKGIDFSFLEEGSVLCLPEGDT
jgi:hypothetical protein